jgi:transcriptional regulator with XRE-family HTH domain
MNREKFGELVCALREEHEDEYGQSWTRKKMAEESGGRLTVSVITNIESGERKHPDRETMLALADTLQLTSGERKEFFLASSVVENKDLAREDLDSDAVLSRLMDRLEKVYMPAYILDSYCDVVAYNSAMPFLLELDDGGPSLAHAHEKLSGCNMLRFVFSEDAVDYYGTRMTSLDWHRFAYQVMMIFRTSTLRYRSSKYFEKLLNELKEHKEFKKYWVSVYFDQRDHEVDNEHIRLDSPVWGHLVYFSTSITAVTVDGELHFCVYVPASPGTAEAFAKIVRQAGHGLHYLADWPDEKKRI